MIPINIGITGHRDISPHKIEEYVSEVKAILSHIQNKYPNTKIQVLAGMAEGADLLCAKVALDLGYAVVAVLPMNKVDFIKTYNNPNKIAVFEEVFSKVGKIIDLSLIYPERKNDIEAYVQLGVYITEHSQALIALWNGVKNNKPGGTSGVVECALNGFPHEYRNRYNIVDNDDTIPVYYVNTERILVDNGNSEIDYRQDISEGFTVLYPVIWNETDIKDVRRYYENILYEIDEYNQESKKPSNQEFYCIDGHDCEQAKTLMGMDQIIQEQSMADGLAKKFQKSTTKFLIIQLICGLFVFLWVSLFDEILAEFFYNAYYILFLVPITFIATIVIYQTCVKKRIESKYYDYRALGECLRAQFYWKLAGIKENTYARYTRKNEWELGWVISAAKNICMDVNYSVFRSKTFIPNYDCIKQYWLAGQIAYFKEKFNRKKGFSQKQKVTIYKWIKWVFFFLGLLFAVALIFEQIYLRHVSDNTFTKHIFLFLIDLLLAVGAIFSAYVEKQQFETELRQYKRMINLFTQGRDEFEVALKSGKKSRIEETIIEIGEEAIAENADWVVFNKTNTIDIPMG